jgi:hypothetical protein
MKRGCAPPVVHDLPFIDSCPTACYSRRIIKDGNMHFHEAQHNWTNFQTGKVIVRPDRFRGIAKEKQVGGGATHS